MLIDVVQSILTDNEQRIGLRISEETAERVLDFLRENDIVTPKELRRKVYEMQDQLDDIRRSVKYIDRRLDTLDEHIRQGEIYLKRRELYQQYQQLKPKKQVAFFEANRAELVLFESARHYLDACLNGHALPLEAWKKEREKLIVERGEFSIEYAALKEQVLDVEKIQRTVERVLREGNHRQKTREK